MSVGPATYTSLDALGAMAGSFSRGQPALLYHKIGRLKRGVVRRGLYMAPRSFRAQLNELRRAGFVSGAAPVPQNAGPSPRVLITFDDGFRSALDHAAPILAETGFRALNFLVSGRLGQTNTWDLADGERLEPLMDEGQIREWLAQGHDIGAHTISHPWLSRLSRASAFEEISGGKKALEDRFGRAVPDFAYPFGDFNPQIRELVGEAGFLRAWTIVPGVVTGDCDPLALPRFPAVVSLRRPLNLLRSVLPGSGGRRPCR